MLRIRKPEVAGQFYPENPEVLRREVMRHLEEGEVIGTCPKALIAPHAGYIYSGPVAGKAYARLVSASARIRKVILLGPAHRTHFYGIATLSHEALSTPLGQVPVARDLIDLIAPMNTVSILDRAHQGEHSLEVHLPFLQVVLNHFSVLPLLIGDATREMVAEVLDRVWGGPETLVVVSSDLSHFLDYHSAKEKDRATSEAICNLNDEPITPDCACGCLPISGLLQVSRIKGLKAELVDLRNSGDTAGSRNEVVGYGAYVFN